MRIYEEFSLCDFPLQSQRVKKMKDGTIFLYKNGYWTWNVCVKYSDEKIYFLYSITEYGRFKQVTYEEIKEKWHESFKESNFINIADARTDSFELGFIKEDVFNLWKTKTLMILSLRN